MGYATNDEQNNLKERSLLLSQLMIASGAAITKRYSAKIAAEILGGRGKELNLLPLTCAGSALPMSFAFMIRDYFMGMSERV